jgi:hypothetical protein
MRAGGSRSTRSAGSLAISPSSAAAFRQTTSVPSVLLTALTAASPASTASASSVTPIRPSGINPNAGKRRIDADAPTPAARAHRRGGGNLAESVVELSHRQLGRKAPTPAPTVGITPTDLPAPRTRGRSPRRQQPVRWTHERHRDVLPDHKERKKGPLCGPFSGCG